MARFSDARARALVLLFALTSACGYGHGLVRPDPSTVDENLGANRFVYHLVVRTALPPGPAATAHVREDPEVPDAIDVGDVMVRMEMSGWGDEGARRMEEEFHPTLASLAGEMGGTHFRVVDVRRRWGYVEILSAHVTREPELVPTDAAALAAPEAHVAIDDDGAQGHFVRFGDSVAAGCTAPCTLSTPPGTTTVHVQLGSQQFERSVDIPAGVSAMLVRTDDHQLEIGIGLLAGYAAIEALGLLIIGGVFTHDWVVNDIAYVATAGASALLGLGLGQLLSHHGDDVRLVPGRGATSVAFRLAPSGLVLTF